MSCLLAIGLLGPLLPLDIPYHTLKLKKLLLFNKLMLECQALPAKSKQNCCPNIPLGSGVAVHADLASPEHKKTKASMIRVRAMK